MTTKHVIKTHLWNSVHPSFAALLISWGLKKRSIARSGTGLNLFIIKSTFYTLLLLIRHRRRLARCATMSFIIFNELFGRHLMDCVSWCVCVLLNLRFFSSIRRRELFLVDPSLGNELASCHETADRRWQKQLRKRRKPNSLRTFYFVNCESNYSCELFTSAWPWMISNYCRC